MRILWALFLRDLRHEASYRLAFLLQMAGTLHIFLIFLFLSRVFTGISIGSLQAYGGGYFPYVLTGLAVQQYLYLALTTYAGQLREAQLMGTFEAVMVCPVPLPAYLAGSVLFAFGLNTLHILVFLLLGVLLGGLHLAWAQVPLLLLVLLLCATAFSCLGILAASYCVVFKKGNPMAWILSAASSLLGGVYFPKEVLPHWLAVLSSCVPMTPALMALRGVVLQGKGLTAIGGPLALLGLWTLVGLPLSCGCFAWAVARARRAGSLGLY